MSSGALMLSSTRIDSMPRWMTTMLIAQKKRKQPSCGRLMPRKALGAASHEGIQIARILKMAKPPIHAWIPNHPHATSARRTAGMFAPRRPNAERQ